MKPKNIILIGMPGVGKSTIGVVLAKNLGYRFVDSDLVIQEKSGKLLHEMITDMGMEDFLQYENDVNASLELNNAILATGGSAIFGEAAMAHLKDIGLVLYLQLPYDEIKERLGDLDKRGVAHKPEQTLSDIFAQRCPLYEKWADLIVDCSGKAIREIVAEIAQKIAD